MEREGEGEELCLLHSFGSYYTGSVRSRQEGFPLGVQCSSNAKKMLLYDTPVQRQPFLCTAALSLATKTAFDFIKWE